jgi:hypothetical protein
MLGVQMTSPLTISALGFQATVTEAISVNPHARKLLIATCVTHNFWVHGRTLEELQRTFEMNCEYHVELDRVFQGHLQHLARDKKVTP